MGLSSLPTEVLLEIAGFLDSPRDIYSLAQTNRRSWVTLKESLYVLALQLAEDSHDCKTNGLLWAVKNGTFESVQNFIHFCPTKRDTSDPSRTLSSIPSQGPALNAAASLGRADIVRLFLDHGADPYAKDWQGFMPLWMATFHGMTEVMRLLLEFGVRADGRDRNGQKQELLPRNAFRKRFWRKLEVYGARMSLVPGGEMRLNCTVPLCVAACLGAEESVRILLDHGANPNAMDATGDMPLHLAVLRDNLAVVELLIEKGANLDIDDVHGRIPLDLALRSSTPQIVKLLIEKGANIEYIEAGRVDRIFRSLECGHFRSWQCDPQELTREEIERFLDDDDYGSDFVMNTLLPSRMINFGNGDSKYENQGHWRHFNLHPHDCEQAVECFLERGSSVDSRDELGRTLLHHAAFHNCEGTVKLLLKRGASPVIKDFYGQTPLHMACAPFRDEPTKIFDMLLEAGADPNVKDYNGETPLHFAARSSYYQAIDAMSCQPSLELMATNFQGNTALHIAVGVADWRSEDKVRTISSLCKARSDPYMKNKLGKTVWDMAKAHDEVSYDSDTFLVLVEWVQMFRHYDVPYDESDSDSKEEDELELDPEARKKLAEWWEKAFEDYQQQQQ